MQYCCRLDASIDNQPFLVSLKEAGVPFVIEVRQGQQELWVSDLAILDRVAQGYAQFKHNQSMRLVPSNMKTLPLTTSILSLCLLVAIVTGMASSGREWFYIAELQFYPRAWFLHDWPQQMWFSVSPIFLHFSIEHLVFNGISFWYLGSQLERRLGLLPFGLLVMLTALSGNYGQLLDSGPLFGGLSGVVYGLIMFAGLYQWRVATLYIPKGLFGLAGVWLVLGYTPLFEMIGLGSMANAAHLFGALGGAVVFALWKVAAKEVSNHERR